MGSQYRQGVLLIIKMSGINNLLSSENTVPILIGIGSTTLIAAGALGYFYIIRKNRPTKNLEYSKRLSRKQRERTESFQALRKEFILNDELESILQLSIEDLIEKLQSRYLSAAIVLRAYMTKALDANEKFNCITEFVPGAMNIAKGLDDLKGVKGPLHGLPVCIKDDTNIVGMDTTLGFAKNLYNSVSDSAVIVKILQDLGAIPFCKTNVPQSLLSHGSENPIFGTTLNCLNPNLSPGGSSSGTGCLVGAGGAAFGTGTDIGGSGRIPAHFNGICSIKPTPNRISGKGIAQAVPNCVGLVGIPSFFAKRAQTLTRIFEGITETNKQTAYDQLVVPIPWRADLYNSKKKLRIGYYTSLSTFPAIGDTEQVVMSAKVALESKGHVLVPFEVPDSFDLNIYEELMFADGAKGLRESFEGEIVAKTLMPLKEFLDSMVSRSQGFRFWKSTDTSLVWEVMCRKRNMIESTLEEMTALKLDLILCPAFPYPALQLCDSFLHQAVCYTLIWNILDFPAGIVPFGIESGENVTNYDDKDIPHLRHVKEVLQNGIAVGMPIGVQIVGKPFMEEQVLRVLSELDEFKQE